MQTHPDHPKGLMPWDLAILPAERRVTVVTSGRYLLPAAVRAEWAAIIAGALGDGPDVVAHFYFWEVSWRLGWILQGGTELPAATLTSVAAELCSRGKRVDLDPDLQPEETQGPLVSC